jgi:hypothetical protein
MDQLSAHSIKNIREPIDGEIGPTAIQTIFGWTIVGKIPTFLTYGPSTKKNVNTHSIAEEVSLTSLADSFHSTESFGIDVVAPNVMSFDDSQCLKVLQTSIKFIRCGWQVDLPLRSSNLNLPDNRTQAVSRYYGMERKMKKPEFQNVAIQYNAIIKKLIDSGTAVKVDKSEINGPMGMVWYLPTHYVTYPNKNKIRVVMDWAVKFKDRCLNEELFRGPKLIPSLIGVLLRTRQFRVAI